MNSTRPAVWSIASITKGVIYVLNLYSLISSLLGSVYTEAATYIDSAIIIYRCYSFKVATCILFFQSTNACVLYSFL